MMKVFVVYPDFDCGIRSIHLTLEGAENVIKAMDQEADKEWEEYKKTDSYKPEFDTKNFFRLESSIGECEVLP